VASADPDVDNVPVRFRPRLADNLLFLGPLSLVGLVFLIFAVASHSWTKGPGQLVSWIVLVVLFAVLPPAYVLTQVLSIEAGSVAVRRGLVRREVPRARIERVVGVLGRVLFLGHRGKILLSIGRYWSDDQIRDAAQALGLKPEGTAKFFGGSL
jgi:hypothetical protein